MTILRSGFDTNNTDCMFACLCTRCWGGHDVLGGRWTIKLNKVIKLLIDLIIAIERDGIQSQ